MEHVIKSCKRLRFAGLMTIGKLGDDNPEPYFRALASCRARAAEKFSLKEQVTTPSPSPLSCPILPLSPLPPCLLSPSWYPSICLPISILLGCGRSWS